MLLCEIDWKAIATLISPIITSSVALYIFFNWKNQKGSEVIATESKEAFKELFDVMNIANKLDRLPSYTFNEETIINEINKLKSNSNVVLKRIYFINSMININNFDNLIDKYKKFELRILNFHKERLQSLVDYRTISGFSVNPTYIPSSNFLELKDYIENIENILKVLQLYSTYQLIPNFK